MLRISLLLLGGCALAGMLWLLLIDRTSKAKQREPIQEKTPAPQDYDQYQMDSREWLGYVVQGAAVLFAVGFIFYRSLFLSLLLAALAFFYPRMKRQQRIGQRKEQLNQEFKEALYALSSSLSAGKSVESGMVDTYQDLLLQYEGTVTLILPELERIIKKLDMNVPVESAFQDLAQSSHLEDIQSFVDVFSICHRSGGNLVEVMKNTSKIISEKLEFKQELRLLLAQRIFEQKLLFAIPFFLVGLLGFTGGDYLEPLFTTLVGRVVMTLALALIGAAGYVSQKIMGIEV